MSADERRDLTQTWKARVEAAPDATAISYFDGTLSARQVDEHTDALAAALQDRGVVKGDRVGLYLQNVPAYPLTLLALWRIGAVAVLLNPMYKGEELTRILDDSGAVGIVCGAPLAAQARAAAADKLWLLPCADTDFQSRNDERVVSHDAGELGSLLDQYAGRTPAPVDVEPDDTALLAYTSGTTGPPKGAMNSHANLLAVTTSYAQWLSLSDDDVVFAIAPLFHITGVVINATIALLTGTNLVLAHRFHPDVVLQAFAEHRVTFTIGSITAFNAMAQAAGDDTRAFDAVRALYSGGAPIPPSTVERFESRFGVYIHNVYGMTETSSAVIAVPLGEQAPVDEASGTLSVGKPMPGLTVRTLRPDGAEADPGEQGELEISGPQVVSGYWQKPDATAETMPDGHLRTGDVAVIDADGWVYLVDRLKDQINVSGYKVWPREVEDALVSHDAVLEAAVVGRPDDYQGESVVAYVSLQTTPAGPEHRDTLAAEIREHVRGRLAAYKVPQEVEIVDELPKTQTGKIRRNALRPGG